MDKLTISGYIGEREPELEQLLESEGIGENFTAAMMRSYLNQNAEASELHIEVNSMGGDVIEGFQIYDLLQAEKKKGKKIFTYGREFSSIASIIYLAGDVRKSYKNSGSFIHNSWRTADSLEGIQLNKEVLNEIAEAHQMADDDILSVYVGIAGRERRRELQDLMRNETSLTDDQLLDLNFSQEIINEPVRAKTKALTVNSNLLNALISKSNQMAENSPNEEKLSSLEQGLNKLKAWLKGAAKNMVLPLANGDIELFIFSEDGEIEGKKAVIAEDGEPTEEVAPAGEHALNDGRTITVGEGGIIESVSEAAQGMSEEEMEAQIAAKDKEMEAMKEEKEKAMKEMEDMKKEYQAFKDEASKQLENLQAEMKALKAEVPGDNKKELDRAQAAQFNTEEWAKLPTSEKLRRKAMYNLKKESK